jgi:hypothetical protein
MFLCIKEMHLGIKAFLLEKIVTLGKQKYERIEK